MIRADAVVANSWILNSLEPLRYTARIGRSGEKAAKPM